MARNLCNQKLAGFNPGPRRDRPVYRQSPKCGFIYVLQPLVGNSRGQLDRKPLSFAFLRENTAACQESESHGPGMPWGTSRIGACSALLPPSASQIDIRPFRVIYFLLPHPGHQEELEPQPLVCITGSEKFVNLFALVDFRFILHESGPVVFFNGETANALRL